MGEEQDPSHLPDTYFVFSSFRGYLQYWDWDPAVKEGYSESWVSQVLPRVRESVEPSPSVGLGLDLRSRKSLRAW